MNDTLQKDVETAMVNVEKEKLDKAYKKLNEFVLEMVINEKLTLLPLYFDKALEGTRTYVGELRLVKSSEGDLKTAPEQLKKLKEGKLTIV